LARGTASRLTFDSHNSQWPVWSPDGGQVAFASSVGGGFHIEQMAMSGTAKSEPLDKAGSQSVNIPLDWSLDGKYIIKTVFDPKTGRDIWGQPLLGDRKPFPYAQTVFDERNAKLSPNGLWLAYSSNETKRDEIYVQTFPQQGRKWQVSTNGGRLPIWSRDGKELFFVGADRKLMVAEVRSGPARDGGNFYAGIPSPLFDTHLGDDVALWYDVSNDGRFLLPVPPERNVGDSVTIVLNWQAVLKK
jgi:Tol biopolymer transport system component